MGMFDRIKFEMKCPNCKKPLSNFQSKVGDCLLQEIDFWEVDNFYDTCEDCNIWVEFTKKRKKTTIKDYKMTIRELPKRLDCQGIKLDSEKGKVSL